MRTCVYIYVCVCERERKKEGKKKLRNRCGNKTSKIIKRHEEEYRKEIRDIKNLKYA